MPTLCPAGVVAGATGLDGACARALAIVAGDPSDTVGPRSRAAVNMADSGAGASILSIWLVIGLAGPGCRPALIEPGDKRPQDGLLIPGKATLTPMISGSVEVDPPTNVVPPSVLWV